jgi:predicted LPLAT superfamily acyltransferase
VTELTPATAVMLATRVERGEFIAIAGDRIPVSHNAQVAWAAFLGKPAPFPIGAYVLASLLQCPTYTLFALRRGGSAEMHFELFRESIRLPRRARAAALQTLAQDYAARLERYCCAAPFQWFNFYDFWRLPVRP